MNSEPQSANIIIDGEIRGTTPAVIELLQGKHELGIELIHHQSWQQSLTITAGEPQDLGTLPLLAADGWVQLLSSPSGANVTIDGEFRGQTPTRIALRPKRSHRVAVYKPGYKTRNTSIRVEADEEKSLNLRLAAQLGRLRVAMSPADAELIINGKSYGSSSQTIEIPAFEQVLEVRRSGYRSYRQRITPRPGFEQALSIALITESDARIADLPAIQQSSIGSKLKLFTPNGLTMGASRREPGRRSNEVLRPVELTRMFYLGLYEVTNADFRNFQKDFTAGQVEGDSLDGDRQPVVFISWEQAAAFCNWLSIKDKFPPYYRIENEVVVGVNAASTGYRMPTEAEWAWAARTGGAKLLKYPWGDNLPPGDDAGNYADASSSYITGRTISNYDDGFITTAPVGSFGANLRGLYDMGGNVAEWMNDYYGVIASSGVIERDPTGPSTGDSRVIRGASWAHGTVTELRLSYRDYGSEGRDDVGFRLARYAEERQ
ncbi:MAG: sulfatase activating formylglycine-generating enzyme [Halieaceae bacterium]